MNNSSTKMDRVLIIETKDIHWTTVEPLVGLMLNDGISVEVYANTHNINSLIIQFKNNQYYEKLNCIEIGIWGMFKMIFSKKRDVIIYSNGFINNKWSINSHLQMFKGLIKQILRIIFIKIHFSKSFLVITSHFVEGFLDLTKWETKIKGSKILSKIEKYTYSFMQNKTHAVNVYSSLVMEEMSELTSNPIMLAPNAVFRSTNKPPLKSEEKTIKIVVPGRIDERRRYYDWINVVCENVKGNHSIILLGRVNSTSDAYIVKKFEDLGYPQEIAATGTFISFEKFDQIVESSDFLLAPLIKLEPYYHSIDRNLGAYFDAIRYGKPIFIPSYSPVSKECSDNVLKYNDDLHLASMINNYIDNPLQRYKIKSKVFNSSKMFSIENLKYLSDLKHIYQNHYVFKCRIKKSSK